MALRTPATKKPAWDPDSWEPVTVGPTWAKTEDGKAYALPEYTLGWEAAEFAARWLHIEDAEEGGNVPFQFTNEQLRFALWFYAIDPVTGKFLYRRALLQRLKGWGKDPFAAVLALFEAVGNCRLDYVDEAGEVHGRPVRGTAYVQIAAVSLDQTRNTADMFKALLTDEAIDHFSFNLGMEVQYAKGGLAEIHCVTSNPRALEGKRPSFIIANEALDVDTPIPVPGGTKRMGDLEAGDTIFGADGSAIKVAVAHPSRMDDDVYRLTMRNGQSVVASGDHLWSTALVGSQAKPRIRTTREMFEDGRKFRIPRAGAQESPNVTLPVDPYLVGLWLGDGSTGDCNITVGDQDLGEVEAELARRGIETHRLKRIEGRAVRLSFTTQRGFGKEMGSDVAHSFRALPCFRDKHIPSEYLHAGTEQRLELLRGLMDSDGHVTKDGSCIFIGTERLARQVVDLASSLGFLPFYTWTADKRSRAGGYARVNFALEGLNPFSMPRKRDRAQVRKRRAWTAVTVARATPREVRCITVDAEDSLFQAGSGVVTHNCQNWVEANRGHRMYGVMKGNLIKHKDQCHMLVIANAPIPGEDSVSEKLIESFNDTIAGKADDRDLLYDSLEAPPNAPLERDAIEKVITIIRGDSIWLDPETVASDFFDPLIPLSESRRKWYNQVVADSDAIYSPEQIKAAEIPAQLRPGDEITLGFDGGRTDDATALVAIRIKDRVAIPIRVWERPRGVEDWIVPHDQVDSAVHDTFSRYKVKAFFADVSLWESFILGWSTDYGEVLEVRASANSPIAWDMSSAKSTTQAHMRLVHALQHAKLRHNGDPILVQHIKNTRKRYNVHGMSFGKESRESSRKVDAYAATLLAFEALNVYLDRMSGKPQKRARTGRVAMY